jgi:peptidyl-prolyl cis-trans isomerase D
MLEKVRKPGRSKSLKSMVWIFLFSLIILVFVFMGVAPDNNSMTGTGTAAIVNGKVISTFDLQEQIRQSEAQNPQDISKLPAAQRQQQLDRMRRETLDQLVRYEFQYQMAVANGILPIPEAVGELITSASAFQENGQFQRDLYFRFLSSRKLSAAEFEDRVGKDIVNNNFRSLFMASWKSPSVMQKLNNELQETKLNIEFVKIDEDNFKVQIDNKDIQDYLVNEENLKKVKARYDTNIEQYSSPVEVKARHILISGNDDKSLAKIKDIQKQIPGKDFAELAKTYSEDPGSKANNGDLGFFGKGRMVKEFEDVAFSLPVGTVSGPVKSSFGYHLIKVEERRGGEKKPFEDIKVQLAKEMLEGSQKESFLVELSAALKEKKNIDSLIKKHQLKWEESGEFPLSQFFVPKIEAGEDAINRVIKLKVQEVDLELLRSGKIAYVLKLKSLKPPVKESELNDENRYWAQASGAMEPMNLWLEEKKKSADIITEN